MYNSLGTENELKDLPQAHSMVLFHICQEALANVAKHAKAKQVDISIWSTDERVLMEIHDNGKGFEMEKMNVEHWSWPCQHANACPCCGW